MLYGAYLRDSDSAGQAASQRCSLVARGWCALATVLAKDLLRKLFVSLLESPCSSLSIAHICAGHAYSPCWIMSSNETAGFLELAMVMLMSGVFLRENMDR